MFPTIVRLFGLEERPDDPVAVTARAQTAEHYAAMDARLAGGDFLAGPLTYADIAFVMAQFFGERKGALMTEATPRLLAWRTRMLARPAVATVLGRMCGWLKAAGRPVPEAYGGIAATASPI